MTSCVFVADLGGTKLSAAAVDRKGRIVARKTVLVDRASALGPVLQIQDLARELAAARSPSSAFAAVAVAIPGLVRPNGTVWAPNLPGWEKMPLSSRLKRTLGIPAIVESDRNAAVLGEQWLGAARGKSDVIVLLVGTGIGAGILSGGRLLRGAHELSGCAGWMVVSGQTGKDIMRLGELEALAAGPAIARSVRRALSGGRKSLLQDIRPQRITAHHVAAAARKGDQLAKQVFDHAGRYLGLGVANLVSLFDPQVVVLAGGMAGASDLYLKSLRKALLERAQPLAVKRVRVAVSKLGGDANLLGCARLAWQSVDLVL